MAQATGFRYNGVSPRRGGGIATRIMPSTHLSLHYHLVFGTKERTSLIDSVWQERLHAYLGGVIGTLGGVSCIVGGTVDHVHLLVGLRATHRLSDVMRELKSVSSTWVHEEIGKSEFAWQEGYGAFTVSASIMEPVRKYIANQKEHHRVRTFREEYETILRNSGVVFDTRYL